MDDRYDDGGISGATLERPALARLLAAIEAGRIDIVAVYKIDRLSCSLLDFAKMIEVFETHGVTFVSITQQFNTTTPMGRLTLNIQLSFAQFEREVTAERIREKIAASRRKGMWMGGNPPLGYDVKDRKLVVNAEEAEVVRMIFERFTTCGSATALARTLRAEGVVTKRGKPIDKGTLYRLINNQSYLGEAVHKACSYPGEHEAILPRALWDKVHAVLKESPRARAYRYYAAAGLAKGEIPTGVVRRVSAAEIEAAGVHELRALLSAPEVVVATWRAAREEDSALTEAEVRDALQSLDPLWEGLFPAEQTRLVQLLVRRVEVHAEGLRLHLRVDGLRSLVADMRAEQDQRRAA